MYLFLDTETTGLPTDGVGYDIRLVQIAWLLYDSSGKLITKKDFIIKPTGFSIPESATKIHGITTQMADSAGKSIEKVFNDFLVALKQCKYLIGHNIEYDVKVIKNEFYRISSSNPLDGIAMICTMKASTGFCKIGSPNNYKWPTLKELYFKIFEKELTGAHRAAVDIEATAKCFWYLVKNNVINLNNHSPIKEAVPDAIVEQKPIHINNTDIMSLRENAIKIKSYIESMKDGESISEKQLSRLYTMLDELLEEINSYEEDQESEDYIEAPLHRQGKNNNSEPIDDLPF